MVVRQSKKKLLLLLLLTVFFASGCSHRVLTFFFTGVPEPRSEEQAAATIILPDSPSRQFDIPPQYQFTHGPWAANRCESCHQESSGRGFNAVKDSSNISRLVLPIEQLCVDCHADEKFVGSPEYWQHGPVANGKCTFCHYPHQSARQFMLVSADNKEMCGQCHISAEIHAGYSVPDQIIDDCVDCHDPHASKGSALLRATLSP